jgi:septal ring factor EnvC (AmiA/AmiB activator)
MKHKLLAAAYDTDTKISTAVISTRLGQFTGTAKIHPDEPEENESKFFGCVLAEARANLKALKALLKEYKIKRTSLIEMKNIFDSLKNIDQSSLEYRRLKRRLCEYNVIINNLEKDIKIIERNIKKAPEQREKMMTLKNKKGQ